MVPTYAPGEVLWARRRFRPIRVGDVVVVPAPTGQGEWLKRVVAVSGDAVTLAGDNPAVSTDSRHVGPVPRRSCRWRLGRSDLR
jgi:Signal peptidase, peptidase S26